MLILVVIFVCYVLICYLGKVLVELKGVDG